MNQRYEYKFVRLGEGLLCVRNSGRSRYQDVVNIHAQEGWRLVQIFAPGVGYMGRAKYYELTKTGRRALKNELNGWVTNTRAMLRLLELRLEDVR